MPLTSGTRSSHAGAAGGDRHGEPLYRKGRQTMKSICLAALIGFLPRLCLAQATGSAAVSGTVRDTMGAFIAGAEVVLNETARNLDRTTTTNEAGLFVFPTVPSGMFTIRVAK